MNMGAGRRSLNVHFSEVHVCCTEECISWLNNNHEFGYAVLTFRIRITDAACPTPQSQKTNKCKHDVLLHDIVPGQTMPNILHLVTTSCADYVVHVDDYLEQCRQH